VQFKTKLKCTTHNLSWHEFHFPWWPTYPSVKNTVLKDCGSSSNWKIPSNTQSTGKSFHFNTYGSKLLARFILIFHVILRILRIFYKMARLVTALCNRHRLFIFSESSIKHFTIKKICNILYCKTTTFIITLLKKLGFNILLHSVRM